MKTALRHTRGRQAGAFLIEFSLILGILLTLIFGVLELARFLYLFNTLQDATRYVAAGAATTNFRDSMALDEIKQHAIFRDGPGELFFGKPVTDAYLHIDYLAHTRDASGALSLRPIAPSSLPACPAQNKMTCMMDPHDESCIRFVRVRICAPGSGSTCDTVPYQTMFSLIQLPIRLPASAAIVPAETLGFTAGSANCN